MLESGILNGLNLMRVSNMAKKRVNKASTTFNILNTKVDTDEKTAEVVSQWLVAVDQLRIAHQSFKRISGNSPLRDQVDEKVECILNLISNVVVLRSFDRE